MKILIKNSETKKWDIAESINTKVEAELQNLIINSPTIIPVDEIREEITPFTVSVSEFGLRGSGSTDVIAFNPDGDIAIIECKLATNNESKRKVIGQILEYASYLWKMSYEDVDSKVFSLKGKNLSDLIAATVDEEWDEGGFRNTIQQSLANGSFILVIVVDEINDELRQIIRYINGCSKSVFSLHALELKRFKSNEIDILVPHLHGTSATDKSPTKKKWNMEEFYKDIGDFDPKTKEVIKDICDWSLKNGNRIYWGVGLNGSFTFQFIKNNEKFSVFSLTSKGILWLNYLWLSNHLDKEIMNEFHNRIHEISSFKKIPNDFSKLPNIRISDSLEGHPEDIEKFKKAISWLGNKIHSLE